MLKNEVAQNWFELDRLEIAQKNDPVDVNGTENRCRMKKIFSLEVRQFQLKKAQSGLYKKYFY